MTGRDFARRIKIVPPTADDCCVSKDAADGQGTTERLSCVEADRDVGTSLIEILVSIVLLGIASASVLAALSGSISASGLERDRAYATAWLQTASDKLELHNTVLCGPGEDVNRVRTAYENEVRRNAEEDNSQGWSPTKISVVTPVRFWNGSTYGTACTDSVQLVTLRVTIDGRFPFTEELQIVKAPLVVTRTVPAPVPPPPVPAPPPCTLSTASITARDGQNIGPNIARQLRTKASHLKNKPITVTLTATGTCNSLRVRYVQSHSSGHDVWSADEGGYVRYVDLQRVGTTYTGKLSPNASEKFELGPLQLTVQQASTAGSSWSDIGGTSTAINIIAPA